MNPLESTVPVKPLVVVTLVPLEEDDDVVVDVVGLFLVLVEGVLVVVFVTLLKGLVAMYLLLVLNWLIRFCVNTFLF